MKVAYKKGTGEVVEAEVEELVMDTTDGWTGEGGVVEGLENDLEATRKFISGLVSCLAEKGVLSEAELGGLLGLSNLREVSE